MTEEIESTRFNTGISGMMEFVNAAYKVNLRLLYQSALSFHFTSTDLFSDFFLL